MIEDGPFRYWLYASRFVPGEGGPEATVADIVATSRARNEAFALSGALIFTGTHFAQYIEGPLVGLERVRESILNDSRHTGVRTIGESSTSSRAFSGWSLAYAGGAEPFDRLIGLALNLGDASAELLLREMLRRFTSSPFDGRQHVAEGKSARAA